MSKAKTVGLYGIENIAAGLNTIVEVVNDVKEAKKEDSASGKKISWVEGVSIVVENAGNALRFANSVDEMGAEVVDLEAKESPALCAEIEKLYSPKNPYVKAGAEKLITGSLWLKEGVEDLLKAKEWEEIEKAKK